LKSALTIFGFVLQSSSRNGRHVARVHCNCTQDEANKAKDCQRPISIKLRIRFSRDQKREFITCAGWCAMSSKRNRNLLAEGVEMRHISF